MSEQEQFKIIVKEPEICGNDTCQRVSIESNGVELVDGTAYPDSDYYRTLWPTALFPEELMAEIENCLGYYESQQKLAESVDKQTGNNSRNKDIIIELASRESIRLISLDKKGNCFREELELPNPLSWESILQAAKSKAIYSARISSRWGNIDFFPSVTFGKNEGKRAKTGVLSDLGGVEGLARFLTATSEIPEDVSQKFLSKLAKLKDSSRFELIDLRY
ncbi:hypothetical protein COT75_01415 [Candidatus Beckwithbacteria bacterium CG10_big_fil_rev_8_21_14_0_10_34_10]|uniref:Uncharacterized protein n=1 Tax=Candidatus Beckwithbacteria bacterium CG10_big_fil_rev_8_21_14_0_10_34_10 TaxID=1974495 RepID=A0A2H0WC11_9BACT|nr:MAG: hypothetical protein COT75_01415 [Candidatus Beckwithbacteria bacterium CG10_big_fil_rev_8_21_14_0_10_34_10]